MTQPASSFSPRIQWEPVNGPPEDVPVEPTPAPQPVADEPAPNPVVPTPVGPAEPQPAVLPEPLPPRPDEVGGLARLLNLAVYGRHLLTGRAQSQMQATALFMLLVFVIDAVVWFAFFNIVANRGAAFVLGWGTGVAGVLALVPALCILLYEREFFRSDTTVNLRRVVVAAGTRIGVVVILAFLTAHIVDLMFFHRAIEQRIHEEGVRQEAGLRVQELKEAESAMLQAKARDPHSEVKKGFVHGEHSQAKQDEGAARTLEAQAKVDAASAATQANEAARRVTAARSDLDQKRKQHRDATARTWQLRSRLRSAEDAALREELESDVAAATQRERATDWAVKQADGALAAAVAQEQQARAMAEKRFSEAAVRKATLEAATRRREKLYDDVKGQITLAEKGKEKQLAMGSGAKERLRRWIRQILAAKPGLVVVETVAPEDRKRGVQPWTYEEPVYDASERLRVLSDLKAGVLPLWTNVAPEDRLDLERSFGLVHAATRDPDARRRLASQAEVVRRVSYLVLGVAILLNLLLLLMKLLVSDELRDYFSRSVQAAGGNEEVLRLQEARQRADAAAEGRRPNNVLSQPEVRFNV